MNYNKIQEEFNFRHEFGGEDIQTLEERHPSVKFFDIPTAWILIVDEMLCLMRYSMPITEVRQVNGLLTVVMRQDIDHHKLRKYREIIQSAEKKLYFIDMDLHLEREHSEQSVTIWH